MKAKKRAIFLLIIAVSFFWSGTPEGSYSNLSPEEKTSIPSEREELQSYILSLRSEMDPIEADTLAEAILRESENLILPKGAMFFGKPLLAEDRLDFLVGIVQTESRFLAHAKSHKGAQGVLQVMPKTAQWLADRHNIPYKDKSELNNPELNLKLGVIYLNEMLAYTKDPNHALLAYNAGPSAWKKWGGVPAYARSIHKHSRQWKEFQKAKRAEKLLAQND